MKKKIINGILLVALIFATSSVFVSCKDNDSDVQTELLGKIASLQQQINDLKGVVGPQGPQGPQGETGAPGQDGHSPVVTIGDNGNWFIDGVDTGKSAKGEDGAPGEPGSTPTIEIGDNGNWIINGEDTGKPSKGDDATVSTEILDQISDIEDEINDLKDQLASKDYVDDAIDDIQTKINELADKIAAIYTTEVTSLNIDAIQNPWFGYISAPIDVQTNILSAFYGKALNDFECGGQTYYAGDVILGTGLAGKIYCTVNPSSVNFTGKTLTLVNTQGQKAPVSLAPLQLSDQVLTFSGGTRASVDNAFYEAEATMNVRDVNNAKLSIAKADLLEIKDDLIDAIKKRNQRTLWDLASDLYTLYAKNVQTAYRLKAAWGAGNTYSESKVAVIAVKPLDFTFEMEGSTITKPLIDFEKHVLGKDYFDVDHKDHAKKAALKFLNEFNKTIGDAVGDINAALQPTLLIREGNRVYRAQYSFTSNITLIPTSWTAELLAPAYWKKITVKCGGETVLEKEGEGARLQEIPMKLESGKTYDIEYTAWDYAGNVRIKNYTISGK